MDSINSLNGQIELLSKTYEEGSLKGKGAELPKAVVDQRDINSSGIKAEVVVGTEHQTNATSGTSVRFGKGEIEGVNSEISFKVVDKETGEVIQEFPKRDLVKAVKSNKISVASGILLDSLE